MEPVNLIFYYHYESRLLGRVFGNRGSKITPQFYKGGAIFCYAAYSNIRVHHKVKLTAEETIMSKLKFEREAIDEGLPV